MPSATVPEPVVKKNPGGNPAGSHCPNHDPVAKKAMEEQLERLRRAEEEQKQKDGLGGASLGADSKKIDSTVAAVTAAGTVPITTVPVPLLKRPLPPTAVDLSVMAKRPSRTTVGLESLLPAAPDTRTGVPASPRPVGPAAQLPFVSTARGEVDQLKARVRQLEEEKLLLEQRVQLSRKGGPDLCCRIKPYDLQVTQGKMVVRRRIAQRMTDLWRENGYYDIQLLAVDVLPVGALSPVRLELRDPNEAERKIYWQQQLDKRAAGEIETVGMEIEDDEDQLAKKQGALLNDIPQLEDTVAVVADALNTDGM